jgi:hypothetical protein
MRLSGARWYFVLQLAESHLTSILFGQILGRIKQLGGGSDLIEMTARVAFDETVAEVNGAIVTTQKKRSEAERDEQGSTLRTPPSSRQALTSPSRWASKYFMQPAGRVHVVDLPKTPRYFRRTCLSLLGSTPKEMSSVIGIRG